MTANRVGFVDDPGDDLATSPNAGTAGSKRCSYEPAFFKARSKELLVADRGRRVSTLTDCCVVTSPNRSSSPRDVSPSA